MSDSKEIPFWIIDKINKKENAYRSLTDLSKEFNFEQQIPY